MIHKIMFYIMIIACFFVWADYLSSVDKGGKKIKKLEKKVRLVKDKLYRAETSNDILRHRIKELKKLCK